MKTIKNLLGLFFVSMLCVSLNSCEEVEKMDTDFFLIGSWASNNDPDNVIYLDFNRDGSGIIEETSYGFSKNIETITWYSSSKYIYVTYDSDFSQYKWSYDLSSERLWIGDYRYIRVD